MDSILEKVIDKMSLDMNVSRHIIKKVVENYYDDVKGRIERCDIMEIDSFKPLYIRGIGTLYPNYKKINDIRKNIYPIMAYEPYTKKKHKFSSMYEASKKVHNIFYLDKKIRIQDIKNSLVSGNEKQGIIFSKI